MTQPELHRTINVRGPSGLEGPMVTRCAGVVLASVMAFAPVGWAQNVKDSGAANPATGEIKPGPQPGEAATGTKVAPWTKPGHPAAQSSNQTEQGPEPQGTKVAPSTNPGQNGEQSH